MSEGHGDAASDVRSFLPRPGEPVEEYAERLRALHRDLTLVLEAVERGLAAAASPAAVPPPVPPEEPPLEMLPVHPAGPEPGSEDVRPPRPAPRGPRVEVLPPPTGEHRRLDEERRRPDPPALPVETREPEPRFTPDAAGPAADTAPRPAPRFPARPSDASSASEPSPEPEWVDREPAQQFTTPTIAPPAPTGLAVTRGLLFAFAVAWLVVVGLLVAVLVS